MTENAAEYPVYMILEEKLRHFLQITTDQKDEPWKLYFAIYLRLRKLGDSKARMSDLPTLLLI